MLAQTLLNQSQLYFVFKNWDMTRRKCGFFLIRGEVTLVLSLHFRLPSLLISRAQNAWHEPLCHTRAKCVTRLLVSHARKPSCFQTTWCHGEPHRAKTSSRGIKQQRDGWRLYSWAGASPEVCEEAQRGVWRVWRGRRRFYPPWTFAAIGLSVWSGRTGRSDWRVSCTHR